MRLPWDRALHTVHGLPYLRPEVALLHKAHLNRLKDRAGLAVAVLDPPARARLVDTLTLLQASAQAIRHSRHLCEPRPLEKRD